MTETAMLIPSTNESNSSKNNFHPMDSKNVYVDEQVNNVCNRSLDNSSIKNRFFNILELVSFSIVLINFFAVSYVDVSNHIQLHQWNKSFGIDSNLITQMRSDTSPYHCIHLITMLSIPICFTWIRGLFTKDTLLRLALIVSSLHIIICLSLILAIFVSLLKPAEVVLTQNISKDEYILLNMSWSLFHLKVLCVLGSVQHIVILAVILWMKLNYSDLFSNEDQCLPLSHEVVIKEEQTTSQAKQEEEEGTDKICDNYVMC